MIVCEVGQNFCGDINLAHNLIELAYLNKGDLVKFQLYDHNKLYDAHPEVPDSSLTFEQARDLFEYGKNIGIEVFFSVFDSERVKWCEQIGVKRYKIACRDCNNNKLVDAVLKTRKPYIISTHQGLNWTNSHAFSYALMQKLYCVPNYPANPKDVDLANLLYYDGFSDHTIGLDCAKIAIAKGAEIIEKHFSLNHTTGIDAPWSMTPSELRELKDWENLCKLVS
jgi:sialic acid synthase SpsE